MKKDKLAVIVPCFCEKEIIANTIKKLSTYLKKLIDKNLVSNKSKIYFIDDGSKDNTKEIIESNINEYIGLIALSKNYGQQPAILAGLNSVDADIYISIDADLQDDYTKIETMIEKYYEGFDAIFGCRKKGNSVSPVKKTNAFLFYKFMNLIGINIRENHSEFRLLSKKAVMRLKKYNEKTIFLRGIIQNMGLKSFDIHYEGKKREKGKTKYSFFKLLNLALEAITDFSVYPIRLIFIAGFLITIASLLTPALMMIFKIGVSKFTIIISAVAFFSGIILSAIGIIGEYLGKILIEVKNRPLYEIEDIINL